jgi:predicted DCC family thiol-disulfide oxidoreductase YuxK
VALSDEAVIRPSRNPLSVSGTAMPENVLLMAKLIAVALFLTNQVNFLPRPYLPFIPGLDRIISGATFQEILQEVFLASMAALLFNYAVRASSLVLGSSILLGVISSRAYYSNNMTLCALLLILAGLSTRGMPPYVLRVQIAVVYFGAGLNKALDPDWHSGQFFDHWAIDSLHQPVYIWLNGLLPPMMLGKLVSWFTIVAELATSILLLIPRTRLFAVFVSVIILQCGFLLFTGSTFGMFFFAMQAAAFCFLPWPVKSMEVIFDGTCGFCDWCREQIERLDFDKLFSWVPYQSGRGRAFGISDEAAARRLQLVTPEGRVLEGFVAFRRMLAYTPAFWMAIFALLAVARGQSAPAWRRIVVVGTLIYFSPLVNRMGTAAYDLIARNRHRIFPGRVCKLPEADERFNVRP